MPSRRPSGTSAVRPPARPAAVGRAARIRGEHPGGQQPHLPLELRKRRPAEPRTDQGPTPGPDPGAHRRRDRFRTGARARRRRSRSLVRAMEQPLGSRSRLWAAAQHYRRAEAARPAVPVVRSPSEPAARRAGTLLNTVGRAGPDPGVARGARRDRAGMLAGAARAPRDLPVARRAQCVS